mgnify:CR=1 FL=1
MPIVLICLMLVYAGLGAFSWLQHKKHNNKSYPLETELLILSGALLVHGAALMFPVLQDRVLITGFGYSLAIGAIEAVNKYGVLGALAGGVTRAAAGISAAIVFGLLNALIFKPHAKP